LACERSITPLSTFLEPETIPQLNEGITALETDEQVKVVVFDSAFMIFLDALQLRREA